MCPALRAHRLTDKRRGRDSNPWRGCKPPHRFSKPALSAPQPPLQIIVSVHFTAVSLISTAILDTYSDTRYPGTSGRDAVTPRPLNTVTSGSRSSHHVRRPFYPVPR